MHNIYDTYPSLKIHQHRKACGTMPLNTCPGTCMGLPIRRRSQPMTVLSCPSWQPCWQALLNRNLSPPERARSTAQAPMSRKRPSSTSARRRCTWLSRTWRGTGQAAQHDEALAGRRAGSTGSGPWPAYARLASGQNKNRRAGQRFLHTRRPGRACSTIGSCSGGRLSGPPCSSHSSNAVSCSLQAA